MQTSMADAILKIVTLRTKTVFNLFLILFSCLLLTQLIMLAFVQYYRVQGRIKNVRQAVSEAAQKIDDGTLPMAYAPDAFSHPPFVNFLLFREGQSDFIYGRSQPDVHNALQSLARQVIASKNSNYQPWGHTWAIFWNQPSLVLAAAPIDSRSAMPGAIVAACDLTDIYAELRPILKIGWAYMGVNALLFTLLGVSRFSTLVFQPLQKLIKRADAYDPADNEYWLDAQEGDGFRHLSASIQRLFRRLNQDQRRLKKTVSELEKSNRKLKQAQFEMVRAEKLASIGRISAGIAHEIGNPIGIVSGYLEMLRNDGGDESERQEFVQRSIDEIERINRIIRQLLDFARPSPKGPEPASVHGVIEDIVAVLRVNPLAEGVNIELQLKAPQYMVLADSDQLRQVILNIVLNALDALATSETDNPHLVIETGPRSVQRQNSAAALEMISVRCSDNGPGIDNENLPYIFDPFFTTKAPGKGTGLGLAVSYMIVENLGGRIRASNLPDKGAAVSMDLPLIFDNNKDANEEPCHPS